MAEETVPVDPRYFIGEGTLTMKGAVPEAGAGIVHFTAGCRNNWHTHPVAQILVVTEGKGIYQEEGKPAQLLTPGTVIVTGKNINHWHGACADTSMTHAAITLVDQNGQNVTWGEPVTDEQYALANQQVAAN